MNFKELFKSKTFWAAISAIIGTVGTAASGAISWKDAIMPVLTSLIGIFLKDALVTQTKELNG